jgi:hypothetical protein
MDNTNTLYLVGLVVLIIAANYVFIKPKLAMMIYSCGAANGSCNIKDCGD